MAVYFGYIEVAGHANGGSHDFDRLGMVLHSIKLRRLGRAHIYAIIQTESKEPTRVKHFGWDYRCTTKCDHDGEAYGVLRYFGFFFVTHERVGSQKLLGTWRISPQAHLIISGLELPCPPGQGLYRAEKVKENKSK